MPPACLAESAPVQRKLPFPVQASRIVGRAGCIKGFCRWRCLRAVRAVPAAPTHAFTAWQAESRRARPVARSTEHGAHPMLAVARSAKCVARSSGQRLNGSVVRRSPRIASRCTRCRGCAFLVSRTSVRCPCRAANEQHRTGRAHRPDAQYHKPFFHFTGPRQPRIVFCACREAAYDCACLTARRLI